MFVCAGDVAGRRHRSFPESIFVEIGGRVTLFCVYACNKQPGPTAQITTGRVELVQLLNVDKNEKGRKESEKAMAMVQREREREKHHEGNEKQQKER